ncbi:MAG TPA: nucleotidyltransferase [Thermoanaerobaculia bacterium]|nr:nucleotidyltransferase [Thermoanaerobaculia bacterium]
MAALAGYRWYLFGAQAVMVWGRPRLTADLDVTVAVDPADAGSFITRLQAFGFSVRLEDPADFILRTRVIPLVHSGSGLPVDVILAGPGLEEQFLERAILVSIGEVDVPVISPEDLIIAKILAGRPKDIEDVRGVIAERASELDFERILLLLGMLEDALSRNDLVSELQRLR